jgi:nicotinamide-nucleotide amidase
MEAEIITIGDELLIGQVVDTNSAWIAHKLNLIGIKIHRIISISDKKEEIIKALDESGKRVDLIILTGGLGPTKDDITKNTLCEYFNTKLIVSEIVIDDIRSFLEKRNVDFNNSNKRQAEVPENCKVIRNYNGTAPGMWFSSGNKTFISLPGVPYEMKSMMDNEVIQRLKASFPSNHIIHKTIYTQGIAESILSEKLAEWEEGLPDKGIKLAYLPQPGIVRLRLSTEGEDLNSLKKLIENEILSLNQIIPDYIFGYDNEKLEEIIGNLLKKHSGTVSVAESCTGGNIARLITSVPGCSDYFKGSAVAYSNEIKVNILNVSRDVLVNHGAVSKEVVEEMARSAMKIFDTDFSVATSGVAGPSGGTKEKPVGSVWIAVSSKKSTISEFFSFGDDRERNITRASVTALNMLRKMIIKSI